MPKNYQYRLWIMIGLATGIRLLLAAFTELGNDEVYYLSYARRPAWSYFDHPAGVGWFIQITSLGLQLNHELFFRLSAIIGAAVNTWLIFRITLLLSGQRAAFLAALLYTSSVYGSLIAGVFILPDSPQVVFWLASVYFCITIIHTRTHQRIALHRWVFLGLSMGMAILCKIHALVLPAGLGVYFLLYERRRFRDIGLYACFFLAILFLLPLLYWNMQNDFISFRFHGARVGPADGLDLNSFFTGLAGQILYNNPIHFFLCILAIITLLKRQAAMPVPLQRLLLWLCLPMIVFFTAVSLFRSILPHWPAPAFLPLLAVAAIQLDARRPVKRTVPLAITVATGLLLAVLVTGFWAIRFAPFTLGSKAAEKTGEGDVTLDMSGWRNLGDSFRQVYSRDTAAGIMKKESVLLSDKWFPAGHLDQYVAHPAGIALLGVGRLEDIHQFAWLNLERPGPSIGSDAYVIIPSNLPSPMIDSLRPLFQRTDPPQIINQMRGGKPVRYFSLYRLHHCTRLSAYISPAAIQKQ